jgi:hypothetical protein
VLGEVVLSGIVGSESELKGKVCRYSPFKIKTRDQCSVVVHRNAWRSTRFHYVAMMWNPRCLIRGSSSRLIC